MQGGFESKDVCPDQDIGAERVSREAWHVEAGRGIGKDTRYGHCKLSCIHHLLLLFASHCHAMELT